MSEDILVIIGWMSAFRSREVLLKAQKTCAMTAPDVVLFNDGLNFKAVSPVAIVKAPATPASIRSGRLRSKTAAASHEAFVPASEKGARDKVPIATLEGAGKCLITNSVTTAYCPPPPPLIAQNIS